MKKVCMLLAEGFEEIEALSVIDILNRGKVFTCCCSITHETLVNGSHSIKVIADSMIYDLDINEYDMLVLPGGKIGTQNLQQSDKVKELISICYKNNKYIAAICAAPSVLGQYGYLKNRKACCYPGFEDKLIEAQVSNNNVEVDGNIITARAMGISLEFSLKLLELLTSKENAEKVAGDILYKDGQSDENL